MPARNHLPKVLAASMLLLVGAIVVGGDQRLLGLARNSLILALAATAIAMPLGILLAVLVGRTNVAGRSLAPWIIAALIVLPLYLHFTGWDAGFGARGWITAAVGRPLDQPLLSSWRGAVWVHAIAAAPWVALIVGLGLAGVEASLEQEAIQDSGMLSVLFRVSFPRAWPWFVVAAVWVAISATTEITITDMYQVRTYAEEVYTGFAMGDRLAEASYSHLGQIALVGVMVGLALSMVAYLAPRFRQAEARRPHRFQLGVFRWPASCVLWLLLAAMFGFPLVNLMVQAGIEVVAGDAHPVRQWSLLKALALLPQAAMEYREEIFWSFAMGTIASSIVVIGAAPLAWWARRSRAALLTLITACALTLSIPSPLVGLGLIALFNDLPWSWLHTVYDRSVAAPVLAMVIKAFPLAAMLIWRSFSQVADDVVESAAVEGASTRQQLTSMGITSQLPALVAAWLLGLAVAMGETAGSFLTMPAGLETIAKRIFGLAHAGVDDQLAALCLVSELIFLTLAALVYFVLQKRSAPPPAAPRHSP